MGIFSKLFSTEKQSEDLNKGLEKTKEGFFGKISRVIAGKSKVDDEVLDDLEEALITADVGVDTTVKIIERLEKRVAKDKFINTSELYQILKTEVQSIFEENNTTDVEGYDLPNSDQPHVMMVVGVNGVGKTTTIGKLSNQFKMAGKDVLLGAADTFRAAAIDQLNVWAERSDVEIVKRDMGSDPAAVAFDTVQSGAAKGKDVIIIDTAGRLHNKVGLMNELTKIRNVMSKVIPAAPHEVLLVLDASTGQNAIEQAKHFTAATKVTAIALTKLDGTAKGGVVLGIADQFQIPIKYIGVGEQIDQLQLFNRGQFIDALFDGVL